MIKLINIELYKLLHSKYFWILGILFLIFLISIPVLIHIFMDNMTKSKEMTQGGQIIVQQVSIFYSSEIWKYLIYIYKLGSFFLSFVIVISITREYGYKTARQNIIDGLSKDQFLFSKLILVFGVSIFFTLLAGGIIMFAGLSYSDLNSFDSLIKNIDHLGYYFLYLTNFLLFVTVLSLLIKRSGVAIAVVIFYVIIIEPILVAVTTYLLEIKGLTSFFPINGINNMLPNPFKEIVVRGGENLVSRGVTVAVVYTILYLFLSYILVKKRDI